MFLSPKDQVHQDWPKIAAYLAKHNLILSLEDPPRQFAAGAANMNFLITLNGDKAVLRRPPAGLLPPGANDVSREYKVLSRLWRFYPYAPKGIHYCDDTSIIGVDFCISEFREGVTIRADLPEALQAVPQIGRKLGKITIEALAVLHAIDPKAAGLEDLGKPDGFIERQIKGWRKRGSLVFDGEDLDLHEEISQWLEKNMPERQPSSIVHNDFKLDNMLIDLDNLKVNGVVDWDMCTLGNPLYELAILLVYWGEQDDPPAYKELTRMPYYADGWMSRREAIETYLKQVPFELSEDELRFYIILVLFRSAVVLAQLCRLYTRGTMRSTAFTKENRDQAKLALPEILRHTKSLINGGPLW